MTSSERLMYVQSTPFVYWEVKTDDTHLVWTGDEMQILLETTRDFKVGKVYEDVDWEA